MAGRHLDETEFWTKFWAKFVLLDGRKNDVFEDIFVVSLRTFRVAHLPR